MRSFDYEFRYLQAAIRSLENYLLSKDSFWPVDIRPPKGEPGYPELSIGGLLLSRARLSAYPMSPAQSSQYDKLISDLNEVRARWKVAWEKKAAHGFSLRLRMWRDFLEDYRHGPQDNADRYAYEVRLRVMLALLKLESGVKVSAEVDLLDVLDRFLKSALVTNDFIWDAELQAGFPKDAYWYLYGRLPSMPLKD